MTFAYLMGPNNEVAWNIYLLFVLVREGVRQRAMGADFAFPLADQDDAPGMPAYKSRVPLWSPLKTSRENSDVYSK